ncbi:glycosyltransferase [Metabacillus endolithicus]|uniref:Glycosyltransferase n=1 Tax=Metabacillus endolithicus TaxID=1535204 RepID=A0ABW5BYR6_9BACI|nr:glycosyltransferase [Metabacillus endolithicus]UPG65551.1 glycosyltransferase [Metabacillus endolithicus]
MKIAVLGPASNVHTKKFLDYYDKQGFDIINISFDSHKDDQDRSHWKNVKTRYLNVGSNKLTYFLTVSTLKKILKEEKPDILHAHYVSSYGVIGALANFHPYVISVWGMDIFDFPKEGALNTYMVKYALGKADMIGSTSEVMKVETAQYTDKKIEVTPFGVNLDVFKPNEVRTESDKVNFGIVKTMTEKYGIRYLLQGYALFKEQVDELTYKNTHLTIVGGGPKLEEYQNLAQELNIADQTTFTGKIPHDQVPNKINEFDVFFVPSTLDSESFGVAAVEAQACEVPVVVANVGGLPEVVLDKQTGFVIPTKDAQAIADKMIYFIHNPEEGKKMGKLGREHVSKHYQWEENAAYMVSLYQKNLL